MKPVEYDRERLMAFRAWLLEEMRLRHWSRAELARRTGVSKGNITKWLRSPDNPDYRRPSLDSAQRIASAVLKPRYLTKNSRSRAFWQCGVIAKP